MQQQVQRPDTPLANTSEPMPVNLQQIPQKPVSKFQATADAAISQIKAMSMQKAMAAQQQQQQQPEQQPNQQ